MAIQAGTYTGRRKKKKGAGKAIVPRFNLSPRANQKTNLGNSLISAGGGPESPHDPTRARLEPVIKPRDNADSELDRR